MPTRFPLDRSDIRDARRGPWLPSGIEALALTDGAGQEVRITREEMLNNPQWYEIENTGWRLLVVPDGEGIRVAEQRCDPAAESAHPAAPPPPEP